jgi:hypothetical protein
MEIAIVEPHFYGIHGGVESIPHYMVIYGYGIDEFYNNLWRDDYKISYRNILRIVHQFPYEHDIIRTYKYNISNHIGLNLVKTYQDEEGRILCVLHTYKLNIFKRIWKKHNNNKNRQL